MILDIDKVLGKPKNRIRRIGLELEGCWNKHPKGISRIEVDRSVFRGHIPPGYEAGEIVSGPIPPIFLSRFVKRAYPQKVDETCGLHIHMSFEHPRYYSVLMDQDYYDTIKEYLKRWAKKEAFPKDHHIWERLGGKSIFCQDIFWPDLQYSNDRKDYDKARKGHRYTITHYCGRLNTIEIRVLPMMGTVDEPDPAQAIRALRHVIDITNACIYTLGKKKEAKVKARAYLANDTPYRETFEATVPVDPKLKLRGD